ncbi:MAG: FeoB-associated Cys-rich membrane protein [Desulfobulbus sp.]
MQHILVAVAVALAGVTLGRRLWNVFRSGQNPGCGCGCPGCTEQNGSQCRRPPFPLYKP